MKHQLLFVFIFSQLSVPNEGMPGPARSNGAFQVKKILQFMGEPEILYFFQIDSNYDVTGLPYPTVLASVITSKHMQISYWKDTTLITRHILNTVNAVLLVGNMRSGQNQDTGGQLCRKSDFPYLCSVRFADKQFIVISTENSELKHEKFIKTYVPRRGRLAIPMLFLWENGGHVEKLVILSAHGNVSQPLQFDEFRTQVYTEYDRELRIPAPCFLDDWERDERIVKTPFQESTQQELSELRCTGRKFAAGTVRVSKFARGQHAHFYPAWGNVVLGECTRALAMISSACVQLRYQGTSPFVVPFGVSSWCAIGALLIIFSALLTASASEHFTPLRTVAVSFLKDLYWVSSLFVGQVNFMGLYSMKTVVLLPIVYFSSVFITNIYLCALSSEFTITSVPELPISSIEELWNFTTILVFSDSNCAVVHDNEKRSVVPFKAGGLICETINTDTAQCKFLDRIRKANQGLGLSRLKRDYKYYFLKDKFEKIEKLQSNLGLVCTSDISKIMKNANNKTAKVAFITSQENFASTWEQFMRLMGAFPGTQYAHKLDAETSYFRPPTWTYIDEYLKENQLWVLRKLQALRSSGIMGLWRKWEFLVASEINARAEEMSRDGESSVKAVALFGSWLEDVFLGIALAWGICIVVFAAEIVAPVFVMSPLVKRWTNSVKPDEKHSY